MSSFAFLLNLPWSPPEAKPLLKNNTPGMFDPITAAHSFPPLSHSSLWVHSASFKLYYPAHIPQCWNLFDYCASRQINYTSTLFLKFSLLLALQSVMYQSKVRGPVLSLALWVLISRLLVRRAPSVKLASSYLNI